jgi:dephospho-CoA kinase
MKKISERLYQIPVPIVALTGGIACGKTTVAKMFIEKKIPLISADELVKEIYQEAESFEFVRKVYPAATTEGKINFSILRSAVFENIDLQSKVEEFIYQRLPEKFLEAFTKFSKPEMVVYDVPLLFEKKLESKVDQIICVYCPKEKQIERLLNRDKISLDLAQKMLQKQIDIEDKKKRSDFVIKNTLDLNHLKAEFLKTFDQIKSLA